MKHLPNLLTLANLFFGCMAIVSALTAHPEFSKNADDIWFIEGMEKMYWASIFIGLAALCDFLDGFAARMLNSFSSLGKDLDSLADMVSFGVAPSMIMYQLLWRAYMVEPGSLATPMLAIVPAFIIPCFAALRLAKYNQTSNEQSAWFKGMPVPAVGMTIAALPLALFFNPEISSGLIENRWLMYLLIIVLSYLMVSNFKFLKIKAPVGGLKGYWALLLIIVISVVAIPFLGWLSLSIAMILYIVFSLIYTYPKPVNSQNN